MGEISLLTKITYATSGVVEDNFTGGYLVVDLLIERLASRQSVFGASLWGTNYCSPFVRLSSVIGRRALDVDQSQQTKGALE